MHEGRHVHQWLHVCLVDLSFRWLPSWLLSLTTECLEYSAGTACGRLVGLRMVYVSAPWRRDDWTEDAYILSFAWKLKWDCFQTAINQRTNQANNQPVNKKPAWVTRHATTNTREIDKQANKRATYPWLVTRPIQQYIQMGFTQTPNPSLTKNCKQILVSDATDELSRFIILNLSVLWVRKRCANPEIFESASVRRFRPRIRCQSTSATREKYWIHIRPHPHWIGLPLVINT